jgi:hypothetical protein
MNGGTRFTKKRAGRQASSLADAPASVLAQLPKELPEVLRSLPLYPPGDPRNATVKAAAAAKAALIHPTLEDVVHRTEVDATFIEAGEPSIVEDAPFPETCKSVKARRAAKAKRAR